MNRTLKILLVVAAIAGLGGLGAYALITRPTKAPTQTAAESEKPLPPVAETTEPTEEPAPAADGKYHIVSEKTTATFTLNELLRGEPKTVIGTTNEVSGEIEADRTKLTDARIGTIRINARTFVTDDEKRNNAIRRLVLKSEDDANEYIEFTPKTISGLPASADIGQRLSFNVTGDLKVSGVTKEVTFESTATFVTEDELRGAAEVKIHYPDWNISVPNLPFLADVDQDVTLKLDFVAAK